MQKPFRLPRGSVAARRFACNALLMIAVNLFMRTVGVSFNVYLSNRAGGEVMGLYSLLSGVYGLALTLGSAGINLGTTRMVADAIGSCTPREDGVIRAGEPPLRLILRKCIGYSLLCSAGAGALMWLCARPIGIYWLNDERTVSSLRILALSLPPIALCACLNGYFTAVRRVAKSAAVGIGTQFFRVGFCTYLLSLWLPKGAEMTCLALVLGGTLSEACGLALTLLAYLYDRARHTRTSKAEDTSCREEGRQTVRKLLGITVPVTLSACLRSGLLTLQHILIPRGLKQSGASWDKALASYGVLHGMVLPVVLFPSAFISSFSGLLVPEVAESWVRGDRERVSRLSERILSPALLFSFGVAGVMACFGYELGEVIYQSHEAGFYIRILAPLIPIMYVDSSVDAFLKGMDEQVYSMNVNILDALVSVILVWILLPRMGLAGYVVAIYATETLNTTLSLCRMLRLSRMPIRLWKQVFGPLLCIVGATWISRLGYGLLPLTAESPTGLILRIAICVALYLLLGYLTGVWGQKHKHA